MRTQMIAQNTCIFIPKTHGIASLEANASAATETNFKRVHNVHCLLTRSR